MRTWSFSCLLVLTLVGCSPSPSSVSTDQTSAVQTADGSDQSVYGEDRPAPPIELGGAPVAREGFEQPRDLALFARPAPPPARPAPGLDAPEMGTGEFAAPQWKTPKFDALSMAQEMVPPPPFVEEPPRVADASRNETIIPHERMVDEVPAAPARIVEELPAVE